MSSKTLLDRGPLNYPLNTLPKRKYPPISLYAGSPARPVFVCPEASPAHNKRCSMSSGTDTEHQSFGTSAFRPSSGGVMAPSIYGRQEWVASDFKKPQTPYRVSLMDSNLARLAQW